MNRGTLSCLLLVIVVALALLSEAPLSTYPVTVRGEFWPARVKQGDDLRWATPAWDDSDWKSGNEVPARAGPYWVRFRFRITDPTLREHIAEASRRGWKLMEEGRIDGFYLASVYAYQVFWDGQLLGGSGTVGTSRESEIAGPLDTLLALSPEMLLPGEHVIAVRISSYRYNFRTKSVPILPILTNIADYRFQEGRRPIFPLIGATAAFLTMIISLVFYGVVERSRPLLICSLLGATLTAFYFLIALRWLYNAPFDWFCPRLFSISVLMTLVAVLFPLLLLDAFSVPHKHRFLLLLVPLLGASWLVSPIYEETVHWLCRSMLVVSLVVSIWAAWRRRPGAWVVAVGVCASLFLVQSYRRDFLSPQFLGAFSVLVLYVFGTVSLQVRENRRRMLETTLTAARLETELLRKSLQPHFLLNSLTVLSEVVEKNPPAAVQLINDLGNTLHTLSRMTGEKLTTLGEEIALCRAHLRVISTRMSRSWSLVVEGIDEHQMVPPAVFLTLVENGLTHQIPPTEGGTFRLEGSHQRKADCFTFFSPGEVRSRSQTAPGGGTGLRYVKARLEESFPGRWHLEHGAVPGGWQTTIELFREV